MRPKPDAVIFDVDGVLVDTEGSYIEGVARAVQWILVHEAGLLDDGPAIDRATVHAWKRVGGWNDDWDLTYATMCWLLAAGGAGTTERRAAADPVERAAARTMADLERAAGARRTLSWEEVRGIFEEIYNGTGVAVERYGVRPHVRVERGLAKTERILLERRTLDELAALGIAKLGIVTGRSRADWPVVAERMPLPAGVAVATMEDGRKPDPAPLRKVVEALRPRSFYSVGDTRSDLELITRWNASDEGRRVPGTAVMLCPAEDEPSYRAGGARMFIRSLSDLPRAIRAAP